MIIMFDSILVMSLDQRTVFKENNDFLTSSKYFEMTYMVKACLGSAYAWRTTHMWPRLVRGSWWSLYSHSATARLVLISSSTHLVFLYLDSWREQSVRTPLRALLLRLAVRRTLKLSSQRWTVSVCMQAFRVSMCTCTLLPNYWNEPTLVLYLFSLSKIWLLYAFSYIYIFIVLNVF